MEKVSGLSRLSTQVVTFASLISGNKERYGVILMNEVVKTIVTNPIVLKMINHYEKKLSQGKVKVLLYHRISPINTNWSLKPIHPKDFDEQIKFIKENYTIIPLAKLKEYLNKKEEIQQRKYAVITFDDGYKDNYLYAYPILKKYGVPATFFITSGMIGTNQLFWWDRVGYAIYHTNLKQIQIKEFGLFSLNSYKDRKAAIKRINTQLKQVPEDVKNNIINHLWEECKLSEVIDIRDNLAMSWEDILDMKADQYDFGAHSMNHPILTNLTLEQLEWQIRDSKKILEENLKMKVNSFAYPNGTRNDYNQTAMDLLRQEGFDYAVTTLCGFNNDTTDCYQLKRVDCGTSLKILQFKISALYCKLEDIKASLNQSVSLMHFYFKKDGETADAISGYNTK